MLPPFSTNRKENDYEAINATMSQGMNKPTEPAAKTQREHPTVYKALYLEAEKDIKQLQERLRCAEECMNSWKRIAGSRTALLRHWQKFAEELSNVLKCSSVDADILEAAKRLQQRCDRLLVALKIATEYLTPTGKITLNPRSPSEVMRDIRAAIAAEQEGK